MSENPKIAKYLADRGICSRREAERAIADGLVKVNGEVITSPAIRIMGGEQIIFNGNEVRKNIEQTRLWMFHKPRGLITTNSDPRGRKTIFEILPKNLPRVMTIGRLDMDSEGLLLLTNSGEFARKMELPASGIIRKYRVRIYGVIPPDMFQKISKGIKIDGIKYAPAAVSYMKNEATEGKNLWLEMAISEGKNREIRRIMEHFGLKVSRLIRTHYGKYELGKLPVGEVMEVKI